MLSPDLSLKCVACGRPLAITTAEDKEWIASEAHYVREEMTEREYGFLRLLKTVFTCFYTRGDAVEWNRRKYGGKDASAGKSPDRETV